MEYIKFNCYDLAAQSVEIHEIHNQVRRLSAELDSICAALEPQIRSTEAIRNQLTSLNNEVAESAQGFLRAYYALDQAVDIYYAAEQRALQTAEGLPTGLNGSGKQGRASTVTTVHTAAEINSDDLIMEDWLAELVYRQ
jgi:small-conductance mechanosensitive channel